jgi:DNA polymerase-1
MERRGLSTDAGMFREMGRRVEADMAVVATRINSKLGRPFNPNSNDHKAELLYGPSPRGLGLPIKKKTDGGAGSTDASVMEYFAGQGVEICQDLLAWSELQKLQGYVVGLPKHISKRTGRIHTTFSPTKVTGRLSSADPNLQNIPRKDNDKYGIRGLLIAPTDMGEDYVLIVSDYAQLEMRVLADISGDEVMIEGIRSGLDMHSYTAAKMNQMEYLDFTALVKSGKAREKLQAKLRDEGVHELDFPVEAQLTERETWAMGMRTAAKAIGFGIVYGITEHGLAVQLTDALGRPVSKEEALSMIEMYLDTFPGVRAYMETTKAVARRTGRVQTYRGRFRHLSKAKSSQKFEMFRAFRQAINARIQGSAHDIVKRAMLYCEFDLYLRDVLKAELVLQVHDELIWQCPRRTAEEAVEIIQHHMEHPFSNPLAVPLVAEPTIVTRWSDAK